MLALLTWAGEATYQVTSVDFPATYVPSMMMARLGFPPLPDLEPMPSGTFERGSESSPYDNERPVHEVNIGYAFQISLYEITFYQYDFYALAQGEPIPSDQGWGRGDRPVIHVNWQEAVDYAAWLSAQKDQACRLPSEAEWEYAARAGSTGGYGLNEDSEPITEANLGDYAWYSVNSDLRAQPVGTKHANAWGLHDMHGNVWEWVQDCWHDSYRGAPVDGSAWEEADGGDCSRRVLRGGAWVDLPAPLRAAVRFWHHPGNRDGALGFRVVCLPR